MILGIDTSCYTTSLAAYCPEAKRILQKRQLLSVAQGQRGLRQSDGVFQHLQRFPELFGQLMGNTAEKVTGVAVSAMPRRAEGSYMPVFTVGERFGSAIATALHVPLVRASHQEGHVLSGEVSSGMEKKTSYLALHLSGGTTEVLHVRSGEDTMDIELLGGTQDLHAGQFVDRIGVALGMMFPAGAALDALAQRAAGKADPFPVFVRGMTCGFSGAEAHAQRLLQHGATAPEEIAYAALRCVCETVERLLRKAYEQTGVADVLLVGGVACNAMLRAVLPPRLGAIGVRVYFARQAYCGDNAAGVAVYGARALRQWEGVVIDESDSD